MPGGILMGNLGFAFVSGPAMTPAPLRCLALLLLTVTVPPTLAAAPVRVVTPVVAEFGERFQLSGTLTADRQAGLSPRVDGLVQRVAVDAGSKVKAGETLMQLDDAVARLALERARAQAAEARTAFEEAERRLVEGRRLLAQQFISATQVATLESGAQSAAAARDSARAAEREQEELLRRHVLPAPFAGVIAAKNVEAGEWVTRGQAVLELVATDRVRLDLRVPQERYAALADGAEVQVYPDALDGVALPAKIESRVPVTDPGARTFLLRLRVEDEAGRLLPGTSARAEVSLPATEPALAIPRDALLRQPDGGYSLFVLEADGEGWVARQRSVRILLDRGQQVAISEGVRAGEQVVVRGNEALRDGQAVRLAGD
jgi:RND family efflux transporter MFP subunit